MECRREEFYLGMESPAWRDLSIWRGISWNDVEKGLVDGRDAGYKLCRVKLSLERQNGRVVADVNYSGLGASQFRGFSGRIGADGCNLGVIGRK